MANSQAFKEKIVAQLARPGGPSATALAEELGIPQPTLSRWLREAGGQAIAGEEAREAKRPQDWSWSERLGVVVEASRLSGVELGALLRRRGLHAKQLEEWRRAAKAALSPPKRRANSPERKQIRRLERELERKEKALAEAAALLVLKKKSRRYGGARTQALARRTGGSPGVGG